MAKFISLEGLHGVGKSTVAELVAKRLGVQLTPTIPSAFSAARKHVSGATSLEARYMLFMAATLSAGEGIEEIVKSKVNVVVESYIFRTIAFHEGMGSKLKLAIPTNLFLPTHTILLTCDPRVRAKRIEDRGGFRNKWDVRAEVLSHQIAERYAQFNFPTVDTSDLEIDAVVNKVMEVINGHV